MTYQRNISGSQEVLDEVVEDRVEGAEVGRGDPEEEDRHAGGLDQRLAVRPLDLLELGPARREEPEDAAALALGGRGLGSAAIRRLLGAGPALALGALRRTPADLVVRLLGLLGP